MTFPDPLPAAASAPPATRRILVVDDNRDAAESLALLLGLDGHDVRAVHDGASALREAAREPPEIVLLDIGMPGMDGYETARRLRAQAAPAGQRPWLVAFTGWGQPEDRHRSRDAGFDHHLVKPVEHDALVSLLARLGEPPAA